MSLVNTKRMLEQAFENNYAVGAFNINNMEILQAVINSAQKNNSDVILQVSKSALLYAGPKYLKYMVQAATEEININVALHLDHGPDFETVKLAIENGFTSVMFDGSQLEYQENIRQTKRVVEFAHEKDITVEAELGKLAGVEDEINVSEKNAMYTDPDQAVDFVEKTGIDSFFYNFMGIGKSSYIKRVIGLPGDHIEIKEDGSVYRNNEKLDEPYLNEQYTNRDTYNDVVVPHGTVFMMGDNRLSSKDSRFFGCVPIEKVNGYVVIRVWPLNKWGKLK